jgi:hypothetical protein
MMNSPPPSSRNRRARRDSKGKSSRMRTARIHAELIGHHIWEFVPPGKMFRLFGMVSSRRSPTSRAQRCRSGNIAAATGLRLIGDSRETHRNKCRSETESINSR